MYVLDETTIKNLGISHSSLIADIGCARGDVTLYLSERARFVVGVDLSKNLIREFYTNINKKGLNNKCFALLGLGEAIPLASQSFDVVICRELLEHVQEPFKIIKEIYRILKPGGKLLITVPTFNTEYIFSRMHPNWLTYCGHCNVFRKNDIINLLKDNGFSLLSVYKKNFFYTYFWFFHCFLKTKFDCTGRPLEHKKLTSILFYLWNLLSVVRLQKIVNKIGDKFLGKSYYFICKKSSD